MFIFVAALLVAKGSFPILLAAAAAGSPPDLTGLAAIITACVGVVGFLATLIRGRKNNQRVDEVEQAASYVEGFDALIKRLEAEIEELHVEQRGERKQYAEEKERLLEIIRGLRAELSESLASHAVTRGELAELQGQVKGFLDPQLYREFMKHLTKKS